MSAAQAPVMKNCPVPGCAARISLELVMCREHWAHVPQDLRNRVWSTLRKAPGSAAHLGALLAAVQHVNDRVERGRIAA